MYLEKVTLNNWKLKQQLYIVHTLNTVKMRITVFQQMDLGEKFKKGWNFQEMISDLYEDVWRQ